MTSRERPLSEKQSTVLWVVGNNEPASVADVGYHLLLDDSNARSTLAALERRGLIDRQYTGHDRGSQFAYRVTTRGAEALAAIDEPTEEPGTCGLCGMGDGKHLRMCAANPNRAPLRAYHARRVS